MSADNTFPDRRDSQEGSIGIGAMIVFIALILVAAVASTIIIKTAEELQQNAENTSSDTRSQISGKVSVADVYIKTTCDTNNDATGAAECAGTDGDGGTQDDVNSMEVIARISSGSLNVQEGDIQYYVSCIVTLDDGSTFATIDAGTVNSLELDGTDIPVGTEITAGTTFKFTLQLTKTNADATDTTVDTDDLASETPMGCDRSAGTGEDLELRIVVNGGGETLANLKINSLTLGKSIM
jgi:archaellin